MRTTTSARWPLAAALISLAGCSHPPPRPGLRMQSQKMPLDAYRLPSGMQVIIEEDHSSPVVGVVAVVSAGNADDPLGKEGLAHLVEHLTFRARPDGKTQRRNLLDHAAAGDVNAITEPDDTVYWEFGPSRSLEGLVRIEANRLAEPLPHIDPATFEVERKVVLNELSEHDAGRLPSEVVTWLAQAAFPPGHPYARSPAGTAESLARIQLDDAQKFVQALYTPARTTWVIAGDVTPDQVKALLSANLPASAYVPAAAPPSPPPPPVAPSSPLTVARHVSMAVTQPTLFLVWPLPPVNAGSASIEQFMAGAVESTADFWVDPDIESASAQIVPGERASMLVCQLALRKGEHSEETAKKVGEALKWVSALGPELPLYLFQRVQALEVTQLGTQVESLRARSVMRAIYAEATHDPAAITSALAGIQHLRPEEVADFAKKYLTADRERSVLVVPNPHAALLHELSSEVARDGRGGAATLGSWGGASGELRAVEDGSRVVYPVEALRGLMVPVRLEDRKEFTLESGLKVVAVRRPGWPQITVALEMPGGIADSEPSGAGYLSQFAGLERPENGAPISSGSLLVRNVGRAMTGIRITGGNGNLENLLGLLDDQVERIRMGRQTVWGMQKWLTEALEKDDTRPINQANRELRTALYGSGTYAGWTDAHVASQVDYDDVNDWIGRVYVPAHAVLAIVGDVDLKTVQLEVQKWLGGWDASGKPVPAPKLVWPQRPTAQVIVKGDKDASQERVRLSCAGPWSTQREALAYELLGQILSESLDREARQDIGATYGFSENVSWLRGGASQIDVTALVNNADLTRVLSQVHHAWAVLGRVGVGEEALNRAKWKLASGYNLALQTSPRLAGTLAWAAVMGLPTDVLAQYPEQLLSVTPAEVKAAAARCRDDSALVVVGDPDVAQAGLKAIWR